MQSAKEYIENKASSESRSGVTETIKDLTGYKFYDSDEDDKLEADRTYFKVTSQVENKVYTSPPPPESTVGSWEYDYVVQKFNKN